MNSKLFSEYIWWNGKRSQQRSPADKNQCGQIGFAAILAKRQDV